MNFAHAQWYQGTKETIWENRIFRPKVKKIFHG